MKAPLTRLLTTADVAHLIGGDTTAGWVREQCESGEIPAYKIGRHWRIDEDEFRGWRERQRFVPDGELKIAPVRPIRRESGTLADLVQRRRIA